MSAKMRFHPDVRFVLIKENESLLELATKAKIIINHSCGGMGTCGTCRVEIIKGGEKLAPRNEIESELAADRGFEDHERLACQTLAIDGLEVNIPVSTTQA